MRAMKDSGIPLVGQIPSNWNTVAIKNTAKGRNTSFVDGDWIESDVIEEEGIRYLTTGNVGAGEYKEQGAGYISETTFQKLNCTEVFAGDLLISRLNEPIGRTCIVPDLGVRIIVAVDVVIYRPNEELYDKRFIVYFMNCAPYAENAKTLSRGSTMQRISRTTLGAIKIAVPPLPEQERIAEYLDGKCAEIDALISVEEQMIAELQAYKQSVITETVTRGLNPDAPLKDSGIPWLGQIPEEWQLKPLKAFCSCNDEVLSETTELDHIIKYVEIGDVDRIYGIKGYTEYKFKDAPSRARRVTRKNDIIISTVRTYLRAITILTEDDLIVSTGFAVIRPQANIDKSFVAYSLRSEPFVNDVIAKSVGINYPAISYLILLSIKIPLPPLPEQKAIAEYLDGKCEEIDALVEMKQRKIEELKEYKKSVIYEYVTGKKEIV